MKKHIYSIMQLHPLSLFVLRHGLFISALMLLVWQILTLFLRSGQKITATLYTCREIYPLLTLMVLSITIVGAVLIDTYARTQK